MFLLREFFMKLFHLSSFSLLIVLTTSFSCFGMEKGEDPGCCGAVKNTASFVADRARDLMRADASGKDIEMGAEDATKQSRRCHLTSFNRKRAALVTALLTLSVAGGGGAYYAFGEHDASPGEVSETVPATPLAPSPSIPLSPVTRILWGAGESAGAGKMSCAAEVKKGKMTTCAISGHQCSSLFNEDFFGKVSDHLMVPIETCEKVGATNGTFYMGAFPVSERRMAWGTDTGPKGKCQVQCMHIYRGFYERLYVCRSSEVAKLYPAEYGVQVVPNLSNRYFLDCTFDERTVAPSASKETKRAAHKQRRAQLKAMQPMHERRPKNPKNRNH
ncbi:hypothetical protein ACFLXW_00425 [Candidatus Dependentiae bacterium]